MNKINIGLAIIGCLLLVCIYAQAKVYTEDYALILKVPQIKISDALEDSAYEYQKEQRHKNNPVIRACGVIIDVRKTCMDFLSVNNRLDACHPSTDKLDQNQVLSKCMNDIIRDINTYPTYACVIKFAETCSMDFESEKFLGCYQQISHRCEMFNGK